MDVAINAQPNFFTSYKFVADSAAVSPLTTARYVVFGPELWGFPQTFQVEGLSGSAGKAIHTMFSEP